MSYSDNNNTGAKGLRISEVNDNGYNRSDLTKTLLSSLGHIKDSSDEEEFFENAVSDINKEYPLNSTDTGFISRQTKLSKTFSFNLYSACSEELLSDEDSYCNDLDIPSIRISNELVVNVKTQLNTLIGKLKELRSSWFDYSTVQDYTSEYITLSKKIVFHPNNTNLDSMAFRRSKTVECIYSIGRVPFFCSEKAKKGYSYFNLNNPFVLDSIQRILINFKDNYTRLKDIPELNPLRNEIFVTQAERAFTRFTSYKNFSNYRVTLNRHNGEIISIPYNNLSSIEEVKPLRLFEKIASFIQALVKDGFHQYRDVGRLTLKILIIGHTEPSLNPDGSSDQRELFDLIHSLLMWYQRSFSDCVDFVPLELIVNNILNEGDIFYDIDSEEKNVLDEKDQIGRNRYRLHVESKSYLQSFYFDSCELKTLCDFNDIIFILDCPWLTTENYDFNSNGQMYLYSRRLQNLNNIRLDNNRPDITNRNPKDDALDNKYRTVMQDLDTHFNRITSSGSTKGGAISRTFRDDLIRKIKEVIEKSSSDKRKDLYIFTSEGSGVDYSYIGGYPLSRTELYGGKRFTIVRFCNSHIDRLKCLDITESKPFDIKIRLWSVLKYISVSYAFIGFRQDLKDTLGELISVPENYIEFLRDVLIILQPSKNLNNKSIRISVGYSNRVRHLAGENAVSPDRLEKILSEAYRFIFNFIKTLYTGVVFADSDNFGDNFIRTAFEMNVYSSAKNVNTMLFLNEYRTAKSEQCLHSYHVQWDEAYRSQFMEDSNYSDEFFMDKKLYDYLLSILKSTDDLSIGTVAMLNSADRVFDTPNMGKKVLDNIIRVCETHSMTDDQLYRNAINAIISLS